MTAGALRAAGETSDCRCACGNLLARVVADGVELKCRRCKRVLLVEISVGSLGRRGSALPVRSVSDSR